MNKTYVLSICELLFLYLCAVEDYKTKRVSCRRCLIFGAAGVLGGVLLKPFRIDSLFLGIGIGMLLIIFSKISHGKVGEGDGWIFCVTGTFSGASGNLALLLFSGWLCAGYALCGMLLKRYKKKDCIAFAPFVLLARVILLMVR